MGIQVVRTQQELRASVAAARTMGKTIGLVPTMGALHAGHVSLVDASRAECGFTVVTIFVNPTQFAPHEDFNKYPRTLEADLAKLAGHGVDVVFAPEAAEVYRAGHATYVEMQGVAEPLEGQRRPGHFRGVATVVLKLFNMATPDVAFFGRKDYQQSLVIRRLVEDFDLPIEIRVCPIIREADGLAMSSRNAYLTAAQRAQSLVLSGSLRRAAELVESGERDARMILAAMREMFAAVPEVRLDYLVLVDPDTLADVQTITGPTVAAIAAFVGATRLIDNQLLASGISSSK
jgi:pantoate--beta-alanine ligase